MTNQISFNPKVQLILSDVDETVADVYRQATPEMINELNKLLEEKKYYFSCQAEDCRVSGNES
jgi:acetamidase/formamidase